MTAAVAFEKVEVGDAIPTLSKVVKREDVKAYADASGDQNPLHQDDAFAKSVGFPGIIAHGMFTMAHVVKAVTDWLGDPGALASIVSAPNPTPAQSTRSAPYGPTVCTVSLASICTRSGCRCRSVTVSVPVSGRAPVYM